MTTVETPTAQKTNGRAVHSVPASSPPPELRGVGWLGFASMMLAIAGIWAAIEGILALSSSKVFTANATYVFSDLRTWGWIVLGLGIASMFAAAGIWTGSQLARWFGIVVAGVNAIGQLMFLHPNPWWSVCMFAVDICVIYALTVYAGPQLRNN